MGTNLFGNIPQHLYGLPQLPSDDFNTLAQQNGLPFQIKADASKNEITPDHLVFTDPAQRDIYVQNGGFTSEFERAYRGLGEIERRQAVKASLEEGRPVVSVTDLTGLPPAEKEMVRHLTAVAGLIESLHRKQLGSDRYWADIEARKDVDPDSYQLFVRNHGPWAEAPKTAANPFANAHPAFPKQKFDNYPQDVDVTDNFLNKLPSELKTPFTVIRKDDKGNLIAVPYHVAYHDHMEAIAVELEAAAQAIEKQTDERALFNYLLAAAQAFRTDDWDSADIKWSAMTMQNSKYALRVAPDEVYWEPGNSKAGFQFWFALIDKDAGKLVEKIAAHKQEIENELAALCPQYKAREIQFDPPDFIKMALITGDGRHARGAVLGEKLPNFNDNIKPRMVVMTNYYTDPESRRTYLEKANLLLDPTSAKFAIDDTQLANINTVQHESTHSFIQSQNMTVKNPDGSDRIGENGKPLTAQEALGDRTVSVFEELKAQTGALYLTNWQLNKGFITQERANLLYTDAVLWCFGHISQGMVEVNGKPKAYSQLAGVQIRALMDAGAIEYVNGKYKLNYEKFPAAVKALQTKVETIYTLGDRAAAEALLKDVTDGEGNKVIHAADVQKLLENFPKASFELGIKLDE